MSWHYSQEQAGGFSLPDYLDGLRSERSKSSDTPVRPCCNGNETGCSTSSQSGTMCEPSTVSPGGDSLMLFRGDFPVKTSAQRVRVQDSPEPVAACGLNISESLKKYGLDLCLQKTHRTYERVDSAPSSKDLPVWGMVFDGECWELGTSARLTSGTECGLWPTPVASDTGIRKKNYAQGGTPLSMAAARFPTPTVQDAKNNGGPSQMKHNTPPLNAVAGGSLNPLWVEWLMGWPIGWTDSKPLGMDRFRSWLQAHSEF